MSRSWASFVATGDPNNANGETKLLLPESRPLMLQSVPTKIHWPKYSDGQENLVWLTQGVTTEKDVSEQSRLSRNRRLIGQIQFP